MNVAASTCPDFRRLGDTSLNSTASSDLDITAVFGASGSGAVPRPRLLNHPSASASLTNLPESQTPPRNSSALAVTYAALAPPVRRNSPISDGGSSAPRVNFPNASLGHSPGGKVVSETANAALGVSASSSVVGAAAPSTAQPQQPPTLSELTRRKRTQTVVNSRPSRLAFDASLAATVAAFDDGMQLSGSTRRVLPLPTQRVTNPPGISPALSPATNRNVSSLAAHLSLTPITIAQNPSHIPSLPFGSPLGSAPSTPEGPLPMASAQVLPCGIQINVQSSSLRLCWKRYRVNFVHMLLVIFTMLSVSATQRLVTVATNVLQEVTAPQVDDSLQLLIGLSLQVEAEKEHLRASIPLLSRSADDAELLQTRPDFVNLSLENRRLQLKREADAARAAERGISNLASTFVKEVLLCHPDECHRMLAELVLHLQLETNQRWEMLKHIDLSVSHVPQSPARIHSRGSGGAFDTPGVVPGDNDRLTFSTELITAPNETINNAETAQVEQQQSPIPPDTAETHEVSQTMPLQPISTLGLDPLPSHAELNSRKLLKADPSTTSMGIDSKIIGAVVALVLLSILARLH